MRDAPGGDPLRREELERWREVYAAELPEAGATCPSEERLAALAMGEVSGAARTELADHVVACPRCAEAYRTLAELHRAAGEAGRGREPERTRKRSWLLAGAAAAALAAAVGLAVFELPERPPGEGAVRGTGAGELDTDPADGARLAAAPERLSWSPGETREEEVTYRVVLYDAESVPLWQSEPTEERSVELPGPVREDLTPGTYYWRIRAEAGFERSSSPLLRFEIER